MKSIKEEANKSMEGMRLLVTASAFALPAPSNRIPHLERSAKMNDQELNRTMEKMIRIVRVVGWVMLIGGGIACIIAIISTFHSSTTLSAKLASTAFALSVPLIGVHFAFTPKEKMLGSIRPLLRRVRDLQDPR